MLVLEGRVFDGTRQVVRDEIRLSWLNRLGASPGWDVSAEVGCSRTRCPRPQLGELLRSQRVI